MIKKIIVFIVVILFHNCTFGQDTLLILQSCKNPSRVREIKIGSELFLGFSQINGLHVINNYSYYGTIKNIKKDTITMKVETEDFTDSLANGITVNTTKKYYDFHWQKREIARDEIRKVNIKDVNYISTSRWNGSGLGIQSTFLFSAIFLLVVSPLVSVNFKTGDFNQKRYYTWLACSGTVFTISLPIFILSMKERKYSIRDYSPNSKSKKYYRIQTK